MNINNNRLSEIRRNYISELSDYYDKREAEIFLNILIEHHFKYSVTDLVLDPDIRLTESEILKLHFAVKDLKKYKPVQYITGQTTFLDYRFKVNDSVLIPRPETEELVLLIENNEKSKGLNVLDIGTGSGCIAISLKLMLDDAEVMAVDIDDEALHIAKSNAEINGCSINFGRMDILTDPGNFKAKFDIIVSNPPYVTHRQKVQMKPNVLDFEPAKALFVSDSDPIIFHRAIAQFAHKKLVNGGRLYVEINEDYGNNIVELFEHMRFSNVLLHKDMLGKDRFVSAVLGK